ncbi:MAG: hypothetical protein AAF740_08975 [Bacteroidota bacterium]
MNPETKIKIPKGFRETTIKWYESPLQKGDYVAVMNADGRFSATIYKVTGSFGGVVDISRGLTEMRLDCWDFYKKLTRMQVKHLENIGIIQKQES